MRASVNTGMTGPWLIGDRLYGSYRGLGASGHLILSRSMATEAANTGSLRMIASMVAMAWMTVVWSRANMRPMAGSDSGVSSRARYIATWRGRATARPLRCDTISIGAIW